MSTLILVRHGQASLFSEDYDRLSALGTEQAERLAGAWLADEVRPDRVWCGSLRRQRQSAAAAGEVFRAAGVPWPDVETEAGLDEYPADDLLPVLVEELAPRDAALRAAAEGLAAARDTAERYRQLHRLLQAALSHWVRGSATTPLPLTWQAFSARVRDTLAAIRAAAGRGATAAVFTSGGPIGISVQTALHAPDATAMELNWRLHNASVTQYTWSGARLSLDRFNDTRHLPRAMLTYR